MSWPEQRVSPPIYNIKARYVAAMLSLSLSLSPFLSVSLTFSVSLSLYFSIPLLHVSPNFIDKLFIVRTFRPPRLSPPPNFPPSIRLHILRKRFSSIFPFDDRSPGNISYRNELITTRTSNVDVAKPLKFRLSKGPLERLPI